MFGYTSKNARNRNRPRFVHCRMGPKLGRILAMKKGKILSTVGLAVFALALSGCSSSGDDAADSAKEIKSIGITVGDISNPFWLAMTNGASESAALGSSTLTSFP